MRRLNVMLEYGGSFIRVGEIMGNSPADAAFSYAPEYLSSADARSLSVSLPIEEVSFSAARTKNYFEGLLPEGFTRRSVAKYVHADEDDYLSILSVLGRECIGALKIEEEGAPEEEPSYKELSMEEVRALAREGAAKSAQLVTKAHLSLAGASGKTGLYYDEQSEKWYLPLGTAPSTHIVKQSHVRFKRIVANELLCMLTAAKLGIKTARSFMVHTFGSDDEDVLFATRRYDRIFSDKSKIICGKTVPVRLHQEDFAQAMGIPSDQKYETAGKAYLKSAFGILRDYSAYPIEDGLRLWDLCIFNYLIGNTDNHIKNLSLLYSEDLKTLRLAPAYDMISTITYEESSDQMAISIGGEFDIRKIMRDSFEQEAENIGLGRKIAMSRFDIMSSRFEEALFSAKEELEKEQNISGLDEICGKILSFR